MKDTTEEDVRDWWESHIENVREAGSASLQVEDCSPPCQVEVFWVSEPLESQASIITHDQDRPDEEIIINGPYQGTDFIQEVAEISKEDRWQKSVPPQNFKSPPGEQPIRADVLASIISGLISRLKQSIFTDLPLHRNRWHNSSRLWGASSYHILVGNVVDFEEYGEDDPVKTTSESDDGGQSGDDSGSEPDSESEKENQQKIGPAGGGFIHPAVWVDQAPDRSFDKKVWGTQFRENEVVYKDEILDDDFLAFRDGLLAVLSDDGDYILNLLNTFMGIGIIGDYFQWRSLQPREFISGRASPEGFKSSTAETSTPSGRNQLWHGESGPEDYDRGIIQSKVINYILDVTEVVFPVSDLRERITLHLQAHTHFLDDEYAASFLLNWTVVEQYIEDILNQKLRDEYNVNRDRRDNIQGRNWFISHLIELSEITDTIDSALYDELDRHRKKRNRVVHNMESVSGKRAEDLDHLVSELLCREVNDELESEDTEPIHHKPIPMKPATRQDHRKGDYDPKKW